MRIISSIDIMNDGAHVHASTLNTCKKKFRKMVRADWMSSRRGKKQPNNQSDCCSALLLFEREPKSAPLRA